LVPVTDIRRVLLAAMFLFAVGSLAVHFKVHPPFGSPGSKGLSFTNSTASVFAFLDVVLVTFLFSRKKTAAWGYLFNGLIVIYGIVIMVHCGWAKAYTPETPLYQYLFTATSPYIIIACTDFLLGYVLYNLWFLDPVKKPEPVGEAAG
jgi:hypothetical protein